MRMLFSFSLLSMLTTPMVLNTPAEATSMPPAARLMAGIAASRSFAAAEQGKGRIRTCRGVLTATPSEGTYRLSDCRIYFDANVGGVEAVRRACKVGYRCRVRARVLHDGEITYVYRAGRPLFVRNR